MKLKELVHDGMGTNRGTGGFKLESLLFLGTGAFFMVTLGLYWFSSYDDTGSVLLLFTACLGILPGSYLFWWSRRSTPRPEDRTDATRADGSGTVGAFADQSLWPLILGVGMGFVALALAFGPWLAVIGGMMGIIAFGGVIMESRRGGAL
ncbi:MAG TPA: cytochrome c oxidase subunit 4 [Acidimicrobiales bacterium]|nr:cytochrome c oxidase subunit 4 [Acidimicrobiales bacterium]